MVRLYHVLFSFYFVKRVTILHILLTEYFDYCDTLDFLHCYDTFRGQCYQAKVVDQDSIPIKRDIFMSICQQIQY